MMKSLRQSQPIPEAKKKTVSKEEAIIQAIIAKSPKLTNEQRQRLQAFQQNQEKKSLIVNQYFEKDREPAVLYTSEVQHKIEESTKNTRKGDSATKNLINLEKQLAGVLPKKGVHGVSRVKPAGKVNDSTVGVSGVTGKSQVLDTKSGSIAGAQVQPSDGNDDGISVYEGGRENRETEWAAIMNWNSLRVKEEMEAAARRKLENSIYLRGELDKQIAEKKGKPRYVTDALVSPLGSPRAAGLSLPVREEDGVDVARKLKEQQEELRKVRDKEMEELERKRQSQVKEGSEFDKKVMDDLALRSAIEKSAEKEKKVKEREFWKRAIEENDRDKIEKDEKAKMDKLQDQRYVIEYMKNMDKRRAAEEEQEKKRRAQFQRLEDYTKSLMMTPTKKDILAENNAFAIDFVMSGMKGSGGGAGKRMVNGMRRDELRRSYEEEMKARNDALKKAEDERMRFGASLNEKAEIEMRQEKARIEEQRLKRLANAEELKRQIAEAQKKKEDLAKMSSFELLYNKPMLKEIAGTSAGNILSRHVVHHP
jgi:hypothetical protein